ncbi:glutathione s-transferase [Fusarium heterosporum]|uniref:Glutathione s-transferase n=1 Tax=Fusarium heterosporum TaxID=42747 RepID=A0A8H5WFQ8_FUSHE|nr:glutathione s-transferase [Fusarium heterosporum]
MSLVLELPAEYGYVLVAATSTFFVNTLHVVLTSKARKASGLKYPIPYASNDLAEKDAEAFKFNCAQRAHANFTENQISFLGALLISGLRYPVASAALGAGWAFSRVFYALGYSAGGPKGRMGGSIGSALCDVSLKFMAAYTSIMYALGN